tara:strand:+ start:1873 stop:2592 length:720 start_codon:yes stop_codon:yes gene_type:complete
MEKGNKIKIFLAIAYTVILTLFLWTFFSKFSLNDLTSYDFIKNNRDYLIEIKEKNLFIVSILFFIFTVIWVFMLGFGTPIFLIGGFIFGKFLGTFLVVLGLTSGATLLYIFANYFLKDFIKEKFSKRFISLNEKFKKNEFIYFLFYRFLGGIPFAISNVIPTLFNIKIKFFFLGSILGMTPQLFIGTTLGSGLEKIINENQVAPSFLEILLYPDVIYPIIGLIVLLIITLIIRNIFYKK